MGNKQTSTYKCIQRFRLGCIIWKKERKKSFLGSFAHLKWKNKSVLKAS
jgi:hypothetical protein